MKTYISIAIFASMTFLGVNNVEAQNYQRGPMMGFSTFDTNEDNIITEKEFNAVKDERMKNGNGQGQGNGKGQGQARGMNISFSDLDIDGDGKVTIKEYDTFHADMMSKHKGHRNAYNKGYNRGYKNGNGHGNMMNAKEIFAKMDTNSDKFVSEDEMIVFRQKRMKEQSDKGGQLRNVGDAPSFESLDLNNDGKVSEEEFMTAHKKMMKKHNGNGNRHGYMMPPMPQFSDMDKNGNGTVTEEEFIEFRQLRVKAQVDKGGQMKGMAEAPTFESIDKNKDGKIDKTEFDSHVKNDCRRSN